MPIGIATLREHVIDDCDEAITVHLHTGNPGTAGTTDRVPTASIGSATIDAYDVDPTTSGWTLHATLARMTASDDPDFGNANAAINGVSWISMFKGSTFYASRQLAASMNIANGSAVTITASTVQVEYTSTDT